MRNQVKVIACGFALLGFALAVISGLLAGNPATMVLGRALIVLMVCNMLGHAAGTILFRVVDEHVHAYEAARPVPEVSLTTAPARSGSSTPLGDEKFSKNVSQGGSA